MTAIKTLETVVIFAALAALPALAAARAFAHGGHAPLATGAHGTLHLLLMGGGLFAAAAIAHLSSHLLRQRHSTNPK